MTRICRICPTRYRRSTGCCLIFSGNCLITWKGWSFSGEEFQETEERLNRINHLKAKYGQTIGKSARIRRRNRSAWIFWSISRNILRN